MEDIAVSRPASLGLDVSWGADLADFARQRSPKRGGCPVTRRRAVSLPKKRARLQLPRLFGWSGSRGRGSSGAAAGIGEDGPEGLPQRGALNALQESQAGSEIPWRNPIPDVLLEVEELEHELASTKVKLAAVSSTVDVLQQKELSLKRKVQEALIYSHQLELQLVHVKMKNFKLQEMVQDSRELEILCAASLPTPASSKSETSAMAGCGDFLNAAQPPVKSHGGALRRCQSAG